MAHLGMAKNVSIPPAYLAGQCLQAVGVGISDGSHAQDGDAYGGDDKADHCGNQIAACDLPQMNGKDQISCAEKHAEEGSGYQKFLFEFQVVLHGIFSISVRVGLFAGFPDRTSLFAYPGKSWERYSLK